MIQYSRKCLEEKCVPKDDPVAGSTSKKVLISRFDREPLAGFVNTQSYLQAEGIELLGLEGTRILVPYADVKLVCFVRDFDKGETWRENRSFSARPKTNGLWIRLRFTDGDSIEGLIANNLLLLDPAGFSIVPPDPTFHNQRIFVHRTAVAEVQVLGVIGSPLRQKPKPKRPGEDQLEMFG